MFKGPVDAIAVSRLKSRHSHTSLFSRSEDLRIYWRCTINKKILTTAIADCTFYELKRRLQHKAKKFGCEIIIADKSCPSSKNLLSLWTQERKAFLSRRTD
jgi:putative transposase